MLLMTFLETPLNINTELAIRLPPCLQREVKLLRGLHPSSMAGPSTDGGGFPAQPRGTEKGEGNRLLSSPLTWHHTPLFHHLISLNPHNTEETNSSHPITGQFLILKISVYCPNHSGFFFNTLLNKPSAFLYKLGFELDVCPSAGQCKRYEHS